MARRKHLSAASANRRRNNSNKNKKISFLYNKQHQDLEDKFARMSITPSKRNQSVKPPTHNSTTPKIQDVTKTASDLEQRRLEPLVPPVIYDLLQDIIVWIGLAETHKDDFYYPLQLKGLEATLHRMASIFPSHMPIDWKYDRATVGKWGRIPDYFTADAYNS